MKKLTLIILSILMTSCSSNDDSELDNTATNLTALTNKWYFIKSQDLHLPEDQQIEYADECEQNRFIKFSEDGAFLEQFYYLHPQNGCIQENPSFGTFELTNSTNLKLTESDGEQYLFAIRTLDANTLSIEYLEENEIYTYEKH